MRLVQQTTVANWEVGTPELFLNGSWGQVCGATFTAPDAAVACRQLGFGAGAVWPTEQAGRPPRPNPEQPVPPEVVLAGSPGCIGTEQTLLECSSRGSRGTPFGMLDECKDDGIDSRSNVVIACVASEDAGTQSGPKK